MHLNNVIFVARDLLDKVDLLCTCAVIRKLVSSENVKNPQILHCCVWLVGVDCKAVPSLVITEIKKILSMMPE
jgi:hypothetical protein